MRLRPAVRDAALVAPVALVLVLSVAYARKGPPHVAAWLAAAGVVIVRFALVAFGVSGRGRTQPH